MSQKISSEVTADVIKNAVAILQRGGLVVFPTETVYGLGADASNPEAVARIFAAKKRPVNHPVIVHLADSKQLKKWAREISPAAQKLAKHFWPGPLTLILSRAAGVLDCVTGGQDTVGVRVPNHPIAQALLKAFGGGIAAPSANHFGRISPTKAVHAKQELGELVDLILDGGECAVGIESTIVDVSNTQPRIVRPGIITASEISAVLGEEILNHDASSALRAPGTMLSHYAPQTLLQLITKTNLEQRVEQMLKSGKSIAVLACYPAILQHPHLHWVQMPDDPKAYAQALYARLREIDQLACAVILAEEVPVHEDWFAVCDRLQKAAAK